MVQSVEKKRSCVQTLSVVDGSGVKATQVWLLHPAWFFLNPSNDCWTNCVLGIKKAKLLKDTWQCVHSMRKRSVRSMMATRTNNIREVYIMFLDVSNVERTSLLWWNGQRTLTDRLSVRPREKKIFSRLRWTRTKTNRNTTWGRGESVTLLSIFLTTIMAEKWLILSTPKLFLRVFCSRSLSRQFLT